MSQSPTTYKLSLIVSLISFLIGCFFTYFMVTTYTTPITEKVNSQVNLDRGPENVALTDEHAHEEVTTSKHEHEHEHEHEENDALALNRQALTNIGIKMGEAGTMILTPKEYKISFSFPGFVRYKPGRSLINVPVPASGIVTKIFAEESEALCPGKPLFEIQLTHEELTSCQFELLSLLRKRDLLTSEQTRLSHLASGIEPQRQREIELQTKENDAAIEVQKQALHFLGIPDQMLEETLIQQRKLITHLTVHVPQSIDATRGIILESYYAHSNPSKDHFKQIEHFQQLEKIFVEKGQAVSLGDSLCVISDLRELWIEGKAFEADEALINTAYSKQTKVTAVFHNMPNDSIPEFVKDLTIRSVSNRLDSTSRTFTCFINLNNYLLTSPTDLPAVHPTTESASVEAQAPLLNWRFKPGQRCELEIETESLTDVFVVPIDALAQDGSETFLFEYIGDEGEKPIWHKRPVVVHYQTTREAVIANDGSIKIGAQIAKRGAQQLYVALTNGGGKLQSTCPCGDHVH